MRLVVIAVCAVLVGCSNEPTGYGPQTNSAALAAYDMEQAQHQFDGLSNQEGGYLNSLSSTIYSNEGLAPR